jgi:hypothetical protein
LVFPGSTRQQTALAKAPFGWEKVTKEIDISFVPLESTTGQNKYKYLF